MKNDRLYGIDISVIEKSKFGSDHIFSAFITPAFILNMDIRQKYCNYINIHTNDINEGNEMCESSIFVMVNNIKSILENPIKYFDCVPAHSDDYDAEYDHIYIKEISVIENTCNLRVIFEASTTIDSILYEYPEKFILVPRFIINSHGNFTRTSIDGFDLMTIKTYESLFVKEEKEDA